MVQIEQLKPCGACGGTLLVTVILDSGDCVRIDDRTLSDFTRAQCAIRRMTRKTLEYPAGVDWSDHIDSLWTDAVRAGHVSL